MASRSAAAHVLSLMALTQLAICSFLVGAASPGPLVLEADSLEVEGLSYLVGALAAVHFDGMNGTGAPAMTLKIHDRFSIAQHYQDVSLTTFAARIVEQPAGIRHLGPFDGGQISTADFRSSANVFIAPLAGHLPPRVAVESTDSWTMRPSDQTNVTQYAFFAPSSRSGDLVTATVDGAQQLVDRTGGRSITFAGAFVVVLYEWDLDVTTGGGTFVVENGYKTYPLPSAPPETGAIVGNATFRQTYVEVTNGTLHLAVPDAKWNAFHMHADDVAVRGTVTLRNATLDSERGDIAFRGDVAMRINSQHAGLRVTLAPAPGFADSNAGQVAVLDITDVSGDGNPSPEFSRDLGGPARWILLAMPVAIGCSVVALARAIPRFRLARLEAHMEAQRYDAVIQQAPGLLTKAMAGKGISTMYVVALLKTGQAAQASDFIKRLPPVCRAPAADLHYLSACADVQLSRFESAVRHLEACLVGDRRYVHEILANPWFASLLGHARLACKLGLAGAEEAYA